MSRSVAMIRARLVTSSLIWHPPPALTSLDIRLVN
jgi:hypothetical protein